MCAQITARNKYTVTGRGLELSPGSKFSIKPDPVRNGQLILARIGDLLIVGRYFGDAGACKWIVQPHRWIDCDSADVRVLGAVA